MSLLARGFNPNFPVLLVHFLNICTLKCWMIFNAWVACVQIQSKSIYELMLRVLLTQAQFTKCQKMDQCPCIFSMTFRFQGPILSWDLRRHKQQTRFNHQHSSLRISNYKFLNSLFCRQNANTEHLNFWVAVGIVFCSHRS